MSQSDPTDSALAAIASIFEKPEPKPAEKQPDADEEMAAAEPGTAAVDVDGYSKSGPGPLEQLRFKWTARRGDDGQYFVDETIGHTSLPISSGPMPKDAVIDFIDERERESRMRFDALRSQIFNPSERGRDDGEG